MQQFVRQSEQGGCHAAGAYGRSHYVVVVQFPIDGAGEYADVGFAGGVEGDAEVGRVARHGRHVEYPPFATGTHVGGKIAAHLCEGEYVQVDESLYPGRVGLGDVFEEEDAGVVDEDVYLVVLRLAPFIEFAGCRRACQVHV